MQFSRLSYYENLQIVHLFDTMHMRKNITKLLWRVLDGRTDKERIENICCDIQEANHTLQSLLLILIAMVVNIILVFLCY
jgi:hypothetical protein